MKKSLLIVGFIAFFLDGFTQEKYIGIGVGGSLPFGVYAGLETEQSDYKDVGFAEYGYTINFVDVQYRFYKNIVIIASGGNISTENHQQLLKSKKESNKDE